MEQLLCCGTADDEAWQRAELVQLWREVGDEVAWRAAERNEVSSLVGAALQRVLPPAEIPGHWHEAVTTVTQRITLYLAELDRAAAALAVDGIQLVALKNSGIARGIYPHPGGCPMGDIDLLVDPRDFRRAHACLVRLGYEFDSRSPLGEKGLVEAEQSGGSEYRVKLQDGSFLWVELQWRPVAGRWIQPHQEPAAAELLRRSDSVPGTTVRLLCPVDNLLQVCLHTAKHSYVRAPGFRLHTDVDRIVRRCGIDWDEFIARVDALQVRVAVYFSLALAAELLRTPVPATALERLRPAGWKERAVRRSLASAGLFDPQARKWSKLGYIVFNLLLYDTAAGVWRAVFPSSEVMRRRYPVGPTWALPWWHARRLWELVWKRAKT
ncbi:MAG: nucleotidyltransferase family protein [Opitutae bacterium]|nr:nucleotidyltransferase family protein [Opitutae bacterium]